MLKIAAIALLAMSAAAFGDTVSLSGSLDPANPNDVLSIMFTLSGTADLSVQTWGYGGTANAPGGTNAAGMVIPPGGFDPYVSLFSGIGSGAKFVASNDDGSCPPGTAAGLFCPDSTLNIAALPAGQYTVALTVFDNFSLAENSGSGTFGDGFIGLGSYYDQISGTFRTPDFAIDLTASGIKLTGTTELPEPGVSLLIGLVLFLLAALKLRNVGLRRFLSQ